MHPTQSLFAAMQAQRLDIQLVPHPHDLMCVSIRDSTPSTEGGSSSVAAVSSSQPDVSPIPPMSSGKRDFSVLLPHIITTIKLMRAACRLINSRAGTTSAGDSALSNIRQGACILRQSPQTSSELTIHVLSSRS